MHIISLAMKDCYLNANYSSDDLSKVWNMTPGKVRYYLAQVNTPMRSKGGSNGGRPGLIPAHIKLIELTHSIVGTKLLSKAMKLHTETVRRVSMEKKCLVDPCAFYTLPERRYKLHKAGLTWDDVDMLEPREERVQ